MAVRCASLARSTGTTGFAWPDGQPYPLQRRTSIHYSLHRSDGATHQVDSDLWLAILDLATVHGWKPSGTESDTLGIDRLGYFDPRGQRVAAEDAQNLGRCLQSGLRNVPEKVLPLEGHSFGDDNTLELLRRAASGDIPGTEEAQAAVEILSGPPKAEAVALVEFLLGGEFTINRQDSRVG